MTLLRVSMLVAACLAHPPKAHPKGKAAPKGKEEPKGHEHDHKCGEGCLHGVFKNATAWTGIYVDGNHNNGKNYGSAEKPKYHGAGQRAVEINKDGEITVYGLDIKDQNPWTATHEYLCNGDGERDGKVVKKADVKPKDKCPLKKGKKMMITGKDAEGNPEGIMDFSAKKLDDKFEDGKTMSHYLHFKVVLKEVNGRKVIEIDGNMWPRIGDFDKAFVMEKKEVPKPWDTYQKPADVPEKEWRVTPEATGMFGGYLIHIVIFSVVILTGVVVAALCMCGSTEENEL